MTPDSSKLTADFAMVGAGLAAIAPPGRPGDPRPVSNKDRLPASHREDC